MLLFIVRAVYFFVALIVLISFFRAMHNTHVIHPITGPSLLQVFLANKRATLARLLACFCAAFLLNIAPSASLFETGQAHAQEAKLVVQGSGLPVPRFVTLKSNKVNMRVGPGREYPLSWVYKQKNLPLKVIAEFDVWRKVTDHEGTTGWVHSQLVTLKRYALIQSRLTKLHRKADSDSPVVAVADRGVLLELQLCEPLWCRVASDDLRAYVRRDDIWGVLETETLN